MKQKYVSFEEAREFARNLNLKSAKEWYKWSKSEERPLSIPKIPYEVYKNKGWMGWGDFLGTGNVRYKDFLAFEEAREFARNLNLKNETQWREWRRSGMKPNNIPSNPNATYKNKGWICWGDFLGTGRIYRKDFFSFEEVKELAHSLDLKSNKEWKKWSKKEGVNFNVPSCPDLVYKGKGWKGWRDFLGEKKIEYLTFEEAREFAISLELKNFREWREFCKSELKPKNIPTNPNKLYRDKGWKGWVDFLGYKKSKYLSFEEARAYAYSLNLKNERAWNEWVKSNLKPSNIPSCPQYVYKNKGWVSWAHFIGSGRFKKSYEKIREFAQSLKLKSRKEWREWSKSEDRPSDIPIHPYLVYKNKGWVSWEDFLGYEKKGFVSFEKAREFARALNFKDVREWKKWSKSGNKPGYIPAYPIATYKDKGWKNWADFLGYTLLSFEKAREYIHNLQLKSLEEWKVWSKSEKRPKYIPGNPYEAYKNEGWLGYRDFIGYDKIQFLSYEKARDFARPLKLKNTIEWFEWSKSGKKPLNIPSSPRETYKDMGWKGWSDFLGYDKSKSKFLVYEQAREFTRTLNLKSKTEWKKYSKNGERPKNIPGCPDDYYKDRGWKGWDDFLGYEKIEFLSYEKAIEFIHTLNLKGETEWRKWLRGGIKPNNIPSCPEKVYNNKGWKGWPDFLGYVKVRNNYTLSYEKAREFAHTLNLKSVTEWSKWSRSGARPSDIHPNPNYKYNNKGWKGWSDFLGYEEKGFVSFEEAREFARSLNLKGVKEWHEWSKSGERPLDIPSRPDNYYKNKGWKGWGDFLSNLNIVGDLEKHVEFLSFEEARKFAHNLNLKSSEKWKEWSASGERPKNIPSKPKEKYKEKGWKGWPDFLGYEKKQFLSYEKARDFARNLKLKSSKEWREWRRNGMKPNNIPSSPDELYKNKGWRGWSDFLGYEEKGFVSFEEAREFARSLNLKGVKEWHEWSKSGERPLNIPSSPNEVYKNKGWMGYGDFLGTEKIDFLPFEEAREFARSLNLKGVKEWHEWSKSEEKPNNIPSTPDGVYKNKGWRGWADFLGYLGNGNHIWSKGALLTLLEDFRPMLNSAPMSVVLSLIPDVILERYLTKEKLQKLYETEMNSPQRIEVVSNIIQEITSFDLDEPIISFDEQESTIDAHFSDGISIVSILDNIYDSQLSQIPDLKYLSYLEDENVIRYLDEERINFILSEHINELWYSVLNNKLDVDNAIKDYSFEGKYPQIIIQTFLKEYEEVMNFELPEGWTYPYEPLLMQKLVAYRISQRKRYGNWSSIGSGKTISAILAGRYVGAKNTLVITFNATIGKENNSGWTKEIKESFRDSNIFTKEDKNIKFIDGEYNYLVLNYEAFQQATSSDFVLELLKNNRFDYIVLDEVQSIKKRGAFTSKRRKVIKDDLIQKVRENNPDYYLLAMTATPVINNLMEVDSIIQLIEPNNVENIGLAENTINYLNMYRKLTNYGIRYKNENDSILKENQYTLLDVKADELYSQATLINSDNPSAQDKLTINAKLEAILPYINTSFGKTTLWTYHVDGIVETAKDFLTEKGFKVGIYTGEENKKTREKVLDDYKHGDIDVLIASRVMGTGLDGLQKVCDTWVFLSLPFTNTDFVQSYGRIDRRGSNFIETGVDVVIPIVSINGIAHSFRWDYDRYMLITHKKNVSDAVVDGINPDEKLLSKEKAISHANESISDFIQIIKNEEEIEIKTHYRL